MKTPIEPKDILKGDVLRWEGEMDGLLQAREFTALHDQHMSSWGGRGKFYLLDRPTPPVELPEEPTLGWANGELRVWRADEVMMRSVGSPSTLREHITAFTPATAIPTDALDELRNEVAMWSQLDPDSIVGKFLVAIDKAANR